MSVLGRLRWAIAEGYIPAYSQGPEPQFTSHETACLLNTSERDAHVEITIFYSDREPAGPYRTTVPARRTKHLRFNDLTDPEPIALGTAMPASSSRTSRSWSSIRDSIHVKPPMLC